MRSCVIVLIGTETASRKWVQYEIKEAWKRGKGIIAEILYLIFDYPHKHYTFKYFAV